MVERERVEGEAARATSGGGPLQPEGGLDEKQAPGETEDDKGGDELGHDEERGKQEEEDNQEKWSEIRVAIEELSPAKLKHRGAEPPGASTLPFLGVAHLLLRVLDKIGPTMAVLRLDVQRNIERLQELYLLDPCKYSTLTEIVEKEVKDGTARKVDSCSRAVLWLTRSMDFTIALLQRLREDSDQQSLAEHVEAVYNVTLKPWHGWISSAAYKIAMKLIPETKVFTGFLLGTDQDPGSLKDEIAKLVLLLQPVLDDIHAMMAKFRLDRLKST